MKKINVSLIGSLGLLALLFSSCGSMRQNSAFTERKYFNFRHHDPVVTINSTQPKTDKQLVVATQPKAILVSAPETSVQPLASVPKPEATKSNPAIAKTTRTTHIANTLPVAAEKINSSNSLTEKVTGYEPAPGSEMAPDQTQGGNSSVNPVLLLVLAIFLSPLGVYLYDNKATSRFWIDLVLWCLGVGVLGIFVFFGILWLVAVVYAVLIVTGSI